MGDRCVLDEQFDCLIEALDLAHDERAIKQALRNFTAAAGFERFAYVNFRANELRVLSNYPVEWQHRYVAKNYSSIDPVIITAKRTMQPFVWSEADSAAGGPEAVQFFSEARSFGIRSGVSIPVRAGFGRTALLSLASGKPRADFAEIRDPLKATTAVAFTHVHLNRLAIRTVRNASFDLSPREATCLAWASFGKTMSEIAMLLGISERSVRFYLEAARAKLGASNVAHAVRLAVEHNLI